MSKAEINKRYKDKIRKNVFDHYGNQCAICGATSNLQIDHINGNGRKERKELGIAAGYHFYHYLRTQGFPEGYRTLCVGCNAMAHYMTDDEIRQHYLAGAERIQNEQTAIASVPNQ